MPMQAFQGLERRFRRIGGRIRSKDEFRFIHSWVGNPLSIGAVAPSSKMLARAMASHVDPHADGPVIELGPGTGPMTQAMVAHGVDPARLVLVEFDPVFCDLLRKRFPAANVVQGDAYSLRKTLDGVLTEPATAVMSGLPLMTKPLRTRVRLLHDAFRLMRPGAPFVQFTYAVVPPVPSTRGGISADRCEKVWMNVPPARVWVYRKGVAAKRHS